MKDELSLLQAQLTYKKRLEAMLQELRSQEAPLAQKVAKLEETMVRERKDVDRLEGRSLAAFVYYALGKKEEKLDAERREYYAARVKHDAAARELEAIRQDIEATEEDLQDLADCEARYAQALEAKRLAIEATGTPEATALMEKKQALTTLHTQQRELEEAIAAGTNVLRTATDVLSSLRNVENLGYLDRFGNNALADKAKHEFWDEAQKNVEQLQIHLQQFNKELSDVSIREALQGSIDRVLKFADAFFDNLFTDTPVPERMRQARTQVDQALDVMLGILRQLQTKLEEVRHKQAQMKTEVDSLILNTEV